MYVGGYTSVYAAFSASVPLNDRRFKAGSLQPRYMKRYLPGGRGQPAVVVPAAIPLTGFVALTPRRFPPPLPTDCSAFLPRYRVLALGFPSLIPSPFSVTIFSDIVCVSFRMLVSQLHSTR